MLTFIPTYYTYTYNTLCTNQCIHVHMYVRTMGHIFIHTYIYIQITHTTYTHILNTLCTNQCIRTHCTSFIDKKLQ